MRAFSATTLLLLLSFCLLAPAPGAFAIHLPGSEEAEFQWHREQLEADLRKPEALLHLNEVFASRPYVRQPEQVRQCLERTAANAQAPDLLKGHAIWFLSILDMEVGRLSDATARRKALGFVCDWLFIGPFDNENKAGFATPYPPEGKIALDQTYPGKQNEVRWRSGHGLFPFGEVYLHDVLRPAETVVGYALTFIHLPEPRDVAIRVGSDDAIKVFIDGQPVITHNAYHPAEFDQVAVGVRLTAGWHRVLVKLCQSHGDWVFMLRVTTPSGAPLPLSPWQGSTDGSSIRVLADAAEIEKLGLCNVTSSVSILPAEDPLRVFQARIQANPKDADAHAHLAHYCAWKRNFDGSERRHITELEAAVAIAPWYPYYHLLLGYLHEDFNARRRALEKATALAPNFGRALYGLAAYNAERKLTDKALEFAEKASQADPDYLAPRLLLARLHSTHFLRAKALQTAQTLAKQYPGSALLQREMARYCEMLNMQEQAEQAYRRAAELDSCSRETRRKLIQIAKDKGDLHAAIAHCDALLQRWPSDASLMLEKADLLATHSQYEQAISLSMAALDLCPHNATALEKLGHFQHRLGQLPAAMNNWQEALALMPQNAALKEYVEFLTPQEDAFEQKYVLDKDALLRLSTEASAPADESAICLLDLTVWKVHASGLHSTFHQRAFKLVNDKAANEFRTFYARYAPLVQDVIVKQARVLKPSGEILTAEAPKIQRLLRGDFGIYYDLRVKAVSFPALQAGDVVEFQYKLNDTGERNPFGAYFGRLAYLRDRYPTKRREYVLITPPDKQVYFSLHGMDVKPSLDSGEETVRVWRLNDLPRLETERNMPGIAEVSPYLHVSTYQTWADVGRWYWGLIREQFQLPAEAKALARELTQGKTGELHKIRALFNHLAKNWRYVGLEFGIHTHKPYPAAEVFRRRFGDCKDKAALLSAMLREVGIDSQIALVRTRRLGLIQPQPASLAAFNHAICYVPSAKLWLDCTAEHSGSQELPFADQGAMVLLIRPNGGELVQTPVSTPASNLHKYSFTLDIRPDGSLSVDGQEEVRGSACSAFRRAYSVRERQRQTFERTWSSLLPGVRVRKVEFSDLTDLESDVRCAFAFDAPNYCIAAGPELAFTTNLLGRRATAQYADQPSRTHDLELSYPRRTECDFTFRLPEGFTCTKGLEDVRQQTPFGLFQRTVQASGSTLQVNEVFQLDVVRVKRDDYARFREFCLFVDERLSDKIRIRK